jgi:hypothetical protein
VFEEHLATSSAGGNGLTVAGDYRHGEESSTALTHEITYEGTFGAKGETVTCILDVGTFHTATVRRDGAGADRHVRIRRVGRGGCVTSACAQLIPRYFNR